MRTIPHTIQKNRIYHFKRRVPSDVLHSPEFAGKPIFQKSLRTKDRATALRLAANESQAFDALVEIARDRKASVVGDASKSPPPIILSGEAPSEMMMGEMAREVYAEAVGRNSTHRDFDLTKNDPGHTQVGFFGGITYETWMTRIDELADPRNADTVWRANRKLKEFGFALDVKSDEFLRLCGKIAQAERAAIEKVLSGPSASDFDEPMTQAKSAGGGGAYKLSDAIALYEKLHPENSAMLKKLSSAGRAWQQLIGIDHFAAITTATVYEFADMLDKLPSSASDRFPNLSFIEAIKANQERKTPYTTLAPKTIKAGYLGPLQAAVSIAVERELIDKNPFYRVKVPGSGDISSKRRPFRIHELNLIFQHPIYTGCASVHRRNTPGSEIIKNEYYWPALIALFSGLRAEEIADMQLAHIKTTFDNGPPHFQVKGTKSRAGIRDVPFHPRLFDVGLGAYIEELRVKGETRLFPNWDSSGSKSKSSGRPVRNFNDRVVDRKTFDAPFPTFHCFRQTLRLELEKANFPAGMRRVTMGHRLENMDRNYLKPQIQDTYEPFCAAIRFDGLKIEHLIKK